MSEPTVAKRVAFIISCEHAGNGVPRGLAGLIPPSLLRTHRAFDRGALELSLALGRELASPVHVNTVTRLVVDLNRSEGSPEVFSRYTAQLAERGQRALIRQFHRPFRAAVLADCRRAHRSRALVVHLSVHSFTPVLRGERRSVDFALLDDPARPLEVAFSRAWLWALAPLEPRLKLARNQPYRGDSDGHTTSLRSVLPQDRYLGIEIEVNQRLFRAGPRRTAGLTAHIIESLRRSLSPPTQRVRR